MFLFYQLISKCTPGPKHTYKYTIHKGQNIIYINAQINYIITLRQLPNSRSIVQPVIILCDMSLYMMSFLSICLQTSGSHKQSQADVTECHMILNIGWQISISQWAIIIQQFSFHLWIKAAVHICGHQMSPKKHVLKSFFNT